MKKIFMILRNNWKKSMFGTGIVAYGINYGINSYHIETVMTAFCEEAVKYGDSPLMYGERHRRITVILNPAANKRKAKKNFEKYCAPLLYLSGAFVSIIETEKEGHARQLASKIDPESDAIVVAGGDGTLSETLTGLMRLKGEFCQIPIGVLPLGKNNTLASSLFGTSENNNVSQIAKATMAIIKGNTKPVDALRIELMDNEAEELKPVYGVAGVEWGMWRDVKKQQEKLWYFGPLRQYASLVFPGPALERNIRAKVSYTSPCSGCSQCLSQRPDLTVVETPKEKPVQSKWWTRLKPQDRIQTQSSTPKIDYTKIVNESCSIVNEKEIECVDVRLTTSNVPKYGDNSIPHLVLSVGPQVRYQGQFLADGLKFIKGKGATVSDSVEVKQIEIRPSSSTSISPKSDSEERNKEDCLSIDNEDYEVRPIRVTVLPHSVKVFCL